MRAGSITDDSIPATLTCDRCGHSEVVEPNTTPDGWRFLMTNTATIAADLCPGCTTLLLDGLR